MITMTSPPIPTGVVTAADLFAQVTAARQDLTLILTKVEVISDRYDRMSRDVADLQSRARILEGLIPAKLAERVIALERWQWRAGGVVAAFAVLGGVVAGLLEVLISHVHLGGHGKALPAAVAPAAGRARYAAQGWPPRS